jgi:hypothetical protein
MEPRNLGIVGADALGLAEGNNRAPRGGESGPGCGMRPPPMLPVSLREPEHGAQHRRHGVEAKAAGNSNSPQLPSPQRLGATAHRGLRAGHEHAGPPGTWETRASPPSTMAVPLSEGTTGAKRDGRSGVGAPHCTEEAGTAARATLRRDGGAGSRNRWRERWRRVRAPKLSQRNLNG